MDVLNVLAKLAPTIAAGLGGPLAGTAVTALEELFGITPAAGATVDERKDVVTAAVATASPELLAAIRAKDQDYALAMQQAGFKNAADLADLAFKTEALYVQDTSDARKINAQNGRVFWLGVIILATFAGLLCASLFGAYALLKGEIHLVDAATVGMVSGFVGTLIGYAAANAQQVVGYFFGSSHGAAQKVDALSNAFSTLRGPIK